MELDVGVPSSSELKILQRLNWNWGLTWINIGGGVDLRPERASLGVEAWHIGIDPFAAFFLSMIRNFAENADLLVSVGVASGLWLIRVSPRVGISPVAVQCDRVLRNKPPVDYKELHTGIKRKCKTLRRKATAVVTKLAPGAFSPRRDDHGGGPSTSASQQ